LESSVYSSIYPLTRSQERRFVIKHADQTKTRIASNLFIVRYSDDFVVLARSKHILEKYVKPSITNFLLERGLFLSSEKTKLFTLSNEKHTLNFLGYSLRYHSNWKHKRGFVKAHIASSAIALFPEKKKVLEFNRKLRDIFRNSLNLNAFSLIVKLNPRIRR
jgi:RNA-directed DNA polymerase